MTAKAKDIPPTTYLLRDVDGELWRRAKAQAAADGIKGGMRTVLVELLERYADGAVRVRAK